MGTENKRRLDGRRVVITGAASGIGRATALRVIEEGATPILLDIDADAARLTLGDAIGHVFEVDITDHEAVEKAVIDAVDVLGGIDGLVNCAGIMLTGATDVFSYEDWHKTINVNLTGSFNLAKACIPYLKAQSGSAIVNIASATGLLPNSPGTVAYAASKGGVIAMSKALAADLAPSVRVNCVCPGLVDTPMGAGFLQNTGNYALRRPADPAEIANAVLFLLSDEASYVTGAVLAADGGRSFH